MANTPLQGLPVPALSDPPNEPAQLQSLATALEGKLVMSFADATSRDAAITSAVRTKGMVAWLNNPGVHTYWNGTIWQPLQDATPLFAIAAVNKTITRNAVSYTQTFNVTVPQFVSTVTGVAYFDLGCFFAGSGNEIECVVFNQAGGTAGSQYWKAFPSTGGTARQSVSVPFQANVSSGAHTMLMRVLNHNPAGGADVNYYNATLTGTYS